MARLEGCSPSAHRAPRRLSMVCRRTNIPILPRGGHGSNVMLIRNSGVRYLLAIAHNLTQWVGKNESKTQSEKETIPLTSRFRSLLYDGDPPHAVGSSSPSVSSPTPYVVRGGLCRTTIRRSQYNSLAKVGKSYVITVQLHMSSAHCYNYLSTRTRAQSASVLRPEDH
jgi:hypothetical protein